LPDVLEGEFDVAYTSYGAIYWRPDLGEWARVIDRFLKPGGIFYIADFHPLSNMFENSNESEESRELKLTNPYFNSGEPQRFETQGSYAAPDPGYTGVEYGWPHPLSEIVNALLSVGLRLEFLREHPFTVDGSRFAGLVKGEDGYYRLTGQKVEIPLLFSIRARK
jgi:SAM-dependent methyltransferase